jgi:hypothetical protein
VLHRFVSVVAAGVVAVLGLLACGSDAKVGTGCGDFVVPGTVVLRPGIALSVHNDEGQAIAQGTSVILVGRSDSAAQTFSPDSVTTWVYVAAGTYSLRVTKPLYRDTTLNDVVVQNADCGTVQTTNIAVTLHPAPSASTVRSISIFGAAFIDRPGNQLRLAAIVDASPGVSRAVRWQIDDPTLASIDQHGQVIGRCTTRGGTVAITAWSIADPSTSAVVRLAVAPADSC